MLRPYHDVSPQRTISKAELGTPAPMRRRTLGRCQPSRAIIDQHCGGMDLTRKRNGLPLARIDLGRRVDHGRFLYENPGGKPSDPLLNRSRGIRLLQLSENGGRYDDSLEEARQHRLGAAQNQVVERRSIGDDDAHEPRAIFLRAASSASRSATE